MKTVFQIILKNIELFNFSIIVTMGNSLKAFDFKNSALTFHKFFFISYKIQKYNFKFQHI